LAKQHAPVWHTFIRSKLCELGQMGTQNVELKREKSNFTRPLDGNRICNETIAHLISRFLFP